MRFCRGFKDRVFGGGMRGNLIRADVPLFQTGHIEGDDSAGALNNLHMHIPVLSCLTTLWIPRK